MLLVSYLLSAPIPLLQLVPVDGGVECRGGTRGGVCGGVLGRAEEEKKHRAEGSQHGKRTAAPPTLMLSDAEWALSLFRPVSHAARLGSQGRGNGLGGGREGTTGVSVLGEYESESKLFSITAVEQ
eukprot:Hpha_TRINITY_DN16376_c1_g3::TRINITY_DN16376_c1_g3_i1::g.61893::m.61893